MTSNMTTAQRCAEYLRHHGTAHNWQQIVMYNYNGHFGGYRGGPNVTFHKYYFDDSSISVHCFYNDAEIWTAEFYIGNRVVATVCSRNLKF